ncbi:hypothetical protein N7445_007572 [Penicillium cf. griseofulvum]|nr:hypothetical protein N7445_007572 [Penicillium cf. griseofulvum]
MSYQKGTSATRQSHFGIADIIRLWKVISLNPKWVPKDYYSPRRSKHENSRLACDTEQSPASTLAYPREDSRV